MVSIIAEIAAILVRELDLPSFPKLVGQVCQRPAAEFACLEICHAAAMHPLAAKLLPSSCSGIQCAQTCHPACQRFVEAIIVQLYTFEVMSLLQHDCAINNASGMCFASSQLHVALTTV